MGVKLVKVFTMWPHKECDLRQYGTVETTVIAQSKFDKRRRASPEWIGAERPSVLQVFGTAPQAPQGSPEREVVGLHARAKAQVELTGP
jgi:hypothetical protein